MKRKGRDEKLARGGEVGMRRRLLNRVRSWDEEEKLVRGGDDVTTGRSWDEEEKLV